jgi:tight adherence protein B
VVTYLFVALAAITGIGILVAAVAVLPKRVSAVPSAEAAKAVHQDRPTVVEILAAAVQPLAELLSRRRQKSGKRTLADSLFEADIRLRTSEFLLIQFAVLVIGGIIGLLRFGVGAQAAVLALVGYLSPLVYVRFRLGRRQNKLAAQLPDALALLSSGLRAGYSLPQAIENVSQHAAPPISEELVRIVREMSIGRTHEQALINFGRRARSEDVDLVVAAVLINSQTGGNLARILDSIAGTIRDRVHVKNQIGALTAQARASGTIITALPFGLATLLYFIAPDYFRPMFSDLIGLTFIGLSLISIALGWFLIRRMARVEV